MCSGSLLIKELDKDWKKNLAKYTGKKDEDVNNKDGAPNVEKSTNNSPVREYEFVEKAVGEYQSGQQMTTVTFSLTKFNIDSADKTQDFETPMTRSKGKEVLNVTPDSPINKLVFNEERPRRYRFLSEAFCSPFAKRAVELKSSITKQEIGVAECMFAAFKNHWDVVFSTEHGVSIRRVVLETLRPDAWVHVSVMSAWASVLNHEEYIRAKHNSVRRLFCSSVMLLPDHYEKDVNTRISVFSVNMERMLRMQQLTSIHGVDLVLIPIIYVKHFYVMCFNLKMCHIHMIDNMGTRESFKSRYIGCLKRWYVSFMFFNTTEVYNYNNNLRICFRGRRGLDTWHL
ncbi:uncharacterized protein LOC143558095 [Bidens hawaiensis]|uniref:uncharacterized protein LOC143558095 n=1 Tax=Bidens hawaiensis TaxID=980011 RepID=UPI00404AC690